MTFAIKVALNPNTTNQSTIQEEGIYILNCICLSLLTPTAAVARWLECPLCVWEVVSSIPGCDRPKSLKLVVAAFPLGTQDYGNRNTTGPPVSG